MDTAVAWCAFLGAWLLVAGPVYQAAVELRDEDIQRDEIGAIMKSVEPPPISPWWWLVPPVHFLLQRRRARDYRSSIMDKLTEEQLAAMVSYLNKASGWLYVALGGLLLAVAATWELREREDWPAAVFWVVIVVMAFGCAANTAVRMDRSAKLLGEQRPARPRTSHDGQ